MCAAMLVPFLPLRQLLNIARALLGRVSLLFLSPLPSQAAGQAAPKLGSIVTYPLKSCRALRHASIQLTSTGLRNDRVMMIVRGGSKGEPRFFSQRQSGALATVSCTPLPPHEQTKEGQTTYELSCPALPGRTLKVRYPPDKHRELPRSLCVLWDDELPLSDLGDAAAGFVTDAVAAWEPPSGSADGPAAWGDLRVVCMPPAGAGYDRAPNPVYFPGSGLLLSGAPPQAALSDGFPILIAGTASLADLNIGDTIFHVLKGCPRCKQSCTDQETGRVGKEPMETLRTFRAMSKRHPEDVFFGQNVAATRGSGVLRVGDVVEVLKREDGFIADKGSIDPGT
ncbi:hypothetical protein TeGR_g12336 [Tetraparma gracilis]|nr:hypothetical protein TeGR_g12336 [Tetraparma gracilis]